MFNYEIFYFFLPFCYFDFIGSILGEINDVAYVYINRASRSIFENFSISNGDDFSFMRFFFAVWENDSAFCSGFFHEGFD
jgi:hypothetical protein